MSLSDAVPDKIKIAVLPLSPVDQNTLCEHIGRGLTYDLISRLSCRKELSVRSFGTVKNIDTNALEHSELRRMLDIEYMAEGKYKLENDSLILYMKLTHFPGGNEIHSKNYILPMDSLSSLPEIVARELVSEMRIKPDPAVKKISLSALTADPDAYRFYLEAVGSSPETAGEWLQCIALLEKSVSIDSLFEPAWTFLGHACLEYSGLVGGEKGLYSDAEENLLRALELNKESPDAAYYLASLYAKTGRPESSLELFSKWSVKYPGYSSFFSGLGYINRYAGKMEESIEAYRKSQLLDSSLANLVSSQMQILKSQIYMGNYAGAAASFGEVCNNLDKLDKKPDEKQLFYAGVINMYMKDTLEAVQLFDSAMLVKPLSVWTKFGQAYKAALTGNMPDLETLSKELESRDIMDGERRYRMVHFYTFAGKKHEALEHLELSVGKGFFNYPYIISDPLTA
ncbi:MAG: hypothetical protein GF417_04650, partial [Candidatus Latescibacteria bacterium]|nr:hypothetical protein [Candidatus Latescibacterota bacterium]